MLYPLGSPLFTAWNGNGQPLSGGKLYCYEAGTSTAKATYADAAGSSANTFPVVLNARGEARVFFSGAAKFVLKDASDVEIWTADYIGGNGVAEVSSMDGLRALGVPAGLVSINLLGYYAPGDGGGGQFYWDAASTATDNGGTVILPTGYTGTGRWLRNYSGAVNVRWFGAKADGVTDDSAAVTAAVAVASEIVNDGVVSISGVQLPVDRHITVRGGGVVVTGAKGFHRSSVDPVTYRATFEGVAFSSSVLNCACIKDDFVFYSGGNVGITVNRCTFTLTNGAVGVAPSGSMFNKLIGNHFKMDASSTAILTIADDGISKTPMETSVSNNTFVGGTAFDQQYIATSTSAFEGFTFSSNHFFASRVYVKRCVSVKFVGDHLVSANLIVDGAYEPVFSGCYFDRNTANVLLLDIRHVDRNTQNLQIIGCSFNAQGFAGDMVAFTGAPTSSTNSTTGVTLSGNHYIGGVNSATTKISGIAINVPFGDIRNINIGGENFFNLYSCIRLGTVLDKSTIDRFEARDVTLYAEGLPANMGQYLLAPFLYRKIPVHLFIPYFVNSGVDEEVGGITIPYGEMFTAPVLTLTTTSVRPNFVGQLSDSYQGSFFLKLIKLAAANNADANGARAYLEGTVTLDGTAYVAPR